MINKLEQLPGRIVKLFRKPELRSENIKALFAQDTIEELVKSNRDPVRIDTIISDENTIMQRYQVPPKEFSQGKVRQIDKLTCGTYVFVLKDGRQSIGSIFTLTGEQAKQVDDRIEAEKKRSLQRLKENIFKNPISLV